MTTTQIIVKRRCDADHVIELTLKEAAALPDILGRLVNSNLRHVGYYTATVAGCRTLYVLTEEELRS